MRKIGHALFVVTLLCAFAALFVPRAVAAAPSCCAQMQMPSGESGVCAAHHQAPAKHEDESPCCHACALGFALLFVAPPDFVYAPTGETSLVSLSSRGESLPHRPPVPPPRAALA